MAKSEDEKVGDQRSEIPTGEEKKRPRAGRYIALVTLDHGGEFFLPGETVELNAHTGQALLALGMVEIAPDRPAE